MKKKLSEKENKSIKINAILNMVNSFFTIGFSLITFPYVSRVLQVTNLGKVNYAASIVSYFVLFAGLGFSTYAIREASSIRKDNKRLELFSSEIFTLNLLTVFVSYIALVLCAFFVPEFFDYRLLLIIHGISIFTAWIGVNWVNVVFEDYLIITIRSIILHLLVIVLMLLLVKNESDYYIYSAITVFSGFAVNVANFMYIQKYVRPKITIYTNYKKHFKPVLLFFSNTLAVSVYLNADVTMIGWMLGDRDVGLYSVAVRIYTAIRIIIAAFYDVAIPRMSRLAAENDEEGIKNLLDKIVNSIILISVPATIGLIQISPEVVMLISGNTYIPASSALQILSCAFFFAVLGGALAYCVSVPFRREKSVLKATVISAVENISLNLVFIPLMGINGAAITTLLAEATVFAVLLIDLRDKFYLFSFHEVCVNLCKCILGALPFIFIKSFLDSFTISYVCKLLFFFFSCTICYLIIEVRIRNKYVKSVGSILRIKFRESKNI